MSRPSDLRLRPVSAEDEAVCLAAHAAMADEAFPFLLEHVDGEPWSDYVDRLDRLRHGIGVPVGRVPAAFLLAEVGGEVVGRASIRFALNEYLERYAGHIGYGVLASHRRRGYATAILAQSLVVARADGVGRVLIACDHDNLASAAVIERCGGVFESQVDDPTDGIAKRRYWID